MVTATREQRRQLVRENKKQPSVLTQLPPAEWEGRAPAGVIEVWRSRDFLVQVYQEPFGLIRLSVCRTAMNSNGRWEDGISWGDLQRVKRECGRGDLDAVEVFPADRDVVNVANMRHLWIQPHPLNFCWRRQ
jgi:hypothetical protein